MKAYYNEHYTRLKLKVGDLVFLCLQNYTIPGVRKKRLSLARVGPFRVKSVTSTGLACELDLSTHWRIYPVALIAEVEL